MTDKPSDDNILAPLTDRMRLLALYMQERAEIEQQHRREIEYMSRSNIPAPANEPTIEDEVLAHG